MLEPCIANVLNFLIQRCLNHRLFFIRIFRVLNTVQSFIFKVHLVASVSAATRLSYHIAAFLSTTFLFFFELFSEVRAAFAAASYILSNPPPNVNNFFVFFYYPTNRVLNDTAEGFD